MKNKVLLVILAISVALNISSCIDTSQVEASYNNKRKLYAPESIWGRECKGYMVIDSQTNVEYWYIEGEGSSLTLLVDQDGKPLVYKGE